MIDHWAKEVAPGPELRKWYGHDQDKWDDFRKRYQSGLDQKGDLIDDLNQRLLPGPYHVRLRRRGRGT